MSPRNITRHENHPGNQRLSRVAAAAIAAMEAHPEHRDDDVGLLALSDAIPPAGGSNDGREGTIVTLGYPDDLTSLDDLLEHVRALARAAHLPLLIEIGGRG